MAAAEDYALVRRQVGLLDRGDFGVLELTGRDRATFLHALVSNEIKARARAGVRRDPARRPRQGAGRPLRVGRRRPDLRAHAAGDGCQDRRGARSLSLLRESGDRGRLARARARRAGRPGRSGDGRAARGRAPAGEAVVPRRREARRHADAAGERRRRDRRGRGVDHVSARRGAEGARGARGRGGAADRPRGVRVAQDRGGHPAVRSRRRRVGAAPGDPVRESPLPQQGLLSRPGSRGEDPRSRSREPDAAGPGARRRPGAAAGRRRRGRRRDGRQGHERDLVARALAADRAGVRPPPARRAGHARVGSLRRSDGGGDGQRAAVRALTGPVAENRLARETSPYLLQHAHNPVDWYPWGEEAFARARAEDKPLLLSVGYSACHWCHVMEHESFENPEIAGVMNRHFVNVKVDREERPDVDQIYMQAVQSMTGQGGWPMTVFLMPDGAPFYGGTYFPPEDRHGLPGFPRLLVALAEAWQQRPGEVSEQGRQIAASLGKMARLRSAGTLLTDEILFSAFQGISAQFDEEHGGLGGAPKFPQPMIWEFVLRFARRSDNPYARRMVHTTLVKMARGGIYDQLGGGFARYSVDRVWLVPHFEKMLYDNAQLASLYLHAWQAFGDPECRRVCEETLDYVLREMTDPAGGFYSAQDADSEGHEGKFFVWTPDEIRAVLGADADAAMAYWGMDRGPNFEGKSILWLPGEPDPARAAGWRGRLFDARERRVKPGRDDKVLAAWNGLMARAFAEAGRALVRTDYLAAARRNAEFVLGSMRADGRLLRTWKAGQAKLKGYLEDHAMVAAALLELYAATFDRLWLDEARGLADEILRLFWDESVGGFFDTGSDHERLIVRPRNLYDNAVPCGSSVAVEVLLRLAALTGDERYERHALSALRPMADLMGRHPTAFGRFLCALDFHLGPRVEVALVAPTKLEETEPLAEEVFGRFMPNLVAAGMVSGRREASAGVPLLEGRAAVDGKATAYVCRNYACELPVTERAALAGQLDALPNR